MSSIRCDSFCHQEGSWRVKTVVVPQDFWWSLRWTGAFLPPSKEKQYFFSHVVTNPISPTNSRQCDIHVDFDYWCQLPRFYMLCSEYHIDRTGINVILFEPKMYHPVRIMYVTVLATVMSSKCCWIMETCPHISRLISPWGRGFQNDINNARVACQVKLAEIELTPYVLNC